MNTDNLKNEERTLSKLRGLYSKYGYRQYKMSKFEEYDLYVRNKSFLVSDNIITFTDTDGKLMALKPDVTLSIIKNTEDAGGFLNKVYYNENVYRVSEGTGSFKEIMQTGLECIGEIDRYAIYEVIMLALESLAEISEDYVLDISHLGIVSDIIAETGASDEIRMRILSCIGEKNLHGISKICAEENINPEKLIKLVSLYGEPSKVIPKLKELIGNSEALAELEEVALMLSESGAGGKLRIDFSVINHMGYYNGFVFSGFINGIAAAVLSGGQYDRLMKKMGKNAGAIGFAVYMDMLERLTGAADSYDADTVVLYDGSADIRDVKKAVEFFASDGKSVTAQKRIPENFKYRKLARLTKEGVEILENNA